MEILSITPLSEPFEARSRVHTMKVAHHTMAALCARGLKDTEVARLTNRSPPTIRNFRVSPAGAELIAQMAEGCDEEIVSEVEYRLALRRRAGTLASERMVDQLEDSSVEIPIRTLLAIAADVDDRTGLGKQSMQVNLNIDVKSRLNAAKERRLKVIEARAGGRLLEYVRGEG